MGGPKALLRFGPQTFLQRCVELLSRPAVSTVVAILGHEAAQVAREAPLPPATRVVENLRHQEGMLSSILCGLDAAAAAEADGVLLQPVDHPLVGVETVDRVAAALQAGAVIAVPSWDQRRGHPGGFAREAWEALRAAPADRGARAVLADHPGWIVHVPGDAGCVAGIDTPEDYARHLGRPPWSVS
jgi:CTP:molybdopterin cytidylyltransferase MocA